MIEVKRAAKQYGTHLVLEECTLTIKKGSIYALVGSNGAGKTTLLKLIAGFLEPASGEILVKGMPVWENREKVQRYIGSLIEVPVFYEHLSAKDNLELHLAYMGMQGDISRVLNAVGLGHISGKPVSTFSLGMRQRLGIARTLLHKPEVLILDEPFNGLDPLGVEEMCGMVKQAASEGITILISSHILSDVFQMADVVGVLANGRIQAEFELKGQKNQEAFMKEVLSIMKGESR